MIDRPLPIYGIHKPYVPISDVEDYLRLGWMPLPHDHEANPYHRDFVHLVFPCKCKMAVPR